MTKIQSDLLGLHYPYFFRVDIVRDEKSSYVATLDIIEVFSGYYTDNPDLALIKAQLLEDDPRVANNGNGYVQVYFVDGLHCRQFLMYDSSCNFTGCRGYSKNILENNKRVIDFLWHYYPEPSRDCKIIVMDGNEYPVIMPRWTEADVDPLFLKPISDDAWHLNAPSDNQGIVSIDDEIQNAEVGVHWIYRNYKSEQVESNVEVEA